VDLRFAPPDLRRLDEVRADALCLPFFAGEKPLRGTGGLVDWRLRGQISKLRVRGRVDGHEGERVLVPGRPLTSFDKLFLLGLGKEEGFGAARAEQACRTLFAMLDDCRVRTAAIVLPGRSTGVLDAEPALESFLRASSGAHEQDEVIVVDDADTHRGLQLLLERERRKARAVSG
jgi:hypothetical protein